jgi:hypothetical protein
MTRVTALKKNAVLRALMKTVSPPRNERRSRRQKAPTNAPRLLNGAVAD